MRTTALEPSQSSGSLPDELPHSARSTTGSGSSTARLQQPWRFALLPPLKKDNVDVTFEEEEEELRTAESVADASSDVRAQQQVCSVCDKLARRIFTGFGPLFPRRPSRMAMCTLLVFVYVTCACVCAGMWV